MGKWLKVTIARLGLLLVIILFIIWLIVINPTNDAKQLIKDRAIGYQNSITSLRQAQNLIIAVPNISDVGLGQPGNIASYADNTKKTAAQIKKIHIAYVSAGQPRTLGVGRRQIIKDVKLAATQSSLSNKYIADSNADLSQAADFSEYNYKVAKILINVLEYNAAVDTANFQPGSDDTNQRLMLAKQGLDNTVIQLQKIQPMQNDLDLKNIISNIKELQASRDNLAQNGDVATWVEAVDQAQSQIVENRQNFWNEQSTKITAKFEADNSKIAPLQNQWRELALKYKLE